jgi:cyanophycinase
MRSIRLLFAVLAFIGIASAQAQPPKPYQYFRAGNPADSGPVKTQPGYALMGGGDDLDEAFQFLCDRAVGGDLVVLRAHGDDEYNPYIQKLCHLNSVATLILPTRQAAMDPFVGATLRKASAIFIAGGDQSNYINFWSGTPVQEAINEAVRAGKPIGGTSAGLAILTEYGYSCQGDAPEDADLVSQLVLDDPFHKRVTIEHGFIQIPILKGLISDTHFAIRDRMGRTLVFSARIKKDGAAVRTVAVQERASVLVTPDGKARVVGFGPAYFIDPAQASGTVEKGQPLTFGPYAVQKVTPGHSFDLNTWTGESTAYTLTVTKGKITSTQPGGSIY